MLGPVQHVLGDVCMLHKDTLDSGELLAEYEEDEFGAHLAEVVDTSAEDDLLANVVNCKVLDTCSLLVLPLASIAVGGDNTIFGFLLWSQFGIGLLLHLFPPLLNLGLLLHVLLVALFLLGVLLVLA